MTRILVTGATGAIGGRLVPELLDRGHAVRCLTRTPAKLDDAPWRARVEVARGDVGDWVSLEQAMRGTQAAYYLVHGMSGRVDRLVEREERMARNFRDRAADLGLERIVYLGGLIDESKLGTASPHMYARYRAGVVLAAGPVPVTELRASLVLSAESASFRMLQASARAPLVLAQPWMRSRSQPIGIDDVVGYLADALEVEEAAGRVIGIGGADVLTYHGMVRAYLRVAGGAWRPSVPVPYGPPELNAPVAAWLSGVDPELALPLLRSARHDSVVTDDLADRLFGRTPIGFDEAVRRALDDRRSAAG